MMVDPAAPHPDITWILEQCSVCLFIEVQAWDFLRGETRRAFAYFLEEGGVVLCVKTSWQDFLTIFLRKYLISVPPYHQLICVCLHLQPVYTVDKTQGVSRLHREVESVGGANDGVNGTLNGRGAPKSTTSSRFQATESFRLSYTDCRDAFDIVCCVCVRDSLSELNRDTPHCAMAKGEGGEQYSNASLLNKPANADGIKLSTKVSSHFKFYFISLASNPKPRRCDITSGVRHNLTSVSQIV